jgi:hypothetical protein
LASRGLDLAFVAMYSHAEGNHQSPETGWLDEDGVAPSRFIESVFGKDGVAGLRSGSAGPKGAPILRGPMSRRKGGPCAGHASDQPSRSSRVGFDDCPGSENHYRANARAY